MSADTNSQLCEIWGKCVYQLLGTSCIKFCFHQTTSELLLYSSNGFMPCLCCGKVSRNPIGCLLSLVAFFFPSNLGGRNHAIIQWWFAWATCKWLIFSYFSPVLFAKKMFFPLVHLDIVSAGLLFDYLFSSHVLCLPIAECKLHQLHSKNNFRNAFTL